MKDFLAALDKRFSGPVSLPEIPSKSGLSWTRAKLTNWIQLYGHPTWSAESVMLAQRSDGSAFVTTVGINKGFEADEKFVSLKINNTKSALASAIDDVGLGAPGEGWLEAPLSYNEAGDIGMWGPWDYAPGKARARSAA